MSERRTIVVRRRVVTCDRARSTPTDPLGVIEDGAVVIEAGRIVAVGPCGGDRRVRRGLSAAASAPVPLVTPGLVDAHTHAPWVGSRHAEYAMRMAGADYEAIAAAGGGIVSSMRAVRGASARGHRRRRSRRASAAWPRSASRPSR